MRTYREMRQEALTTLHHAGWFLRLFGVSLVLGGIRNLAVGLVNDFYANHGIQTWTMFAEARAQQLAGGLDLTVPSAAIARQMWGASAFQLFIGTIFYGILAYGMAVVQLRAVRRTPGACLGAALGGFARPLGLAWLVFRISLQTALWTLLFVIPGIVAFYRYRQAFFVKADHPDWSAGRCIAESIRLMDGRKGRSFAYDCSYWLPVCLLMILLGAQTLLTMTVGGASAELVRLLLAGGALWAGLYYAVGQAVFYTEILKEDTHDLEAA